MDGYLVMPEYFTPSQVAAMFPRARLEGQADLFQPMCKDCTVRALSNPKART